MGNAGMGNAGIAVSAASAVNAGTAPLADNGLGRFTSPLTRRFVLVSSSNPAARSDGVMAAGIP